MYISQNPVAAATFYKRFQKEIPQTPGIEPAVFGEIHGRFFRLSYGDLSIPHQERSGVALYGIVSKGKIYAFLYMGLQRESLDYYYCFCLPSSAACFADLSQASFSSSLS